MQSYAVGIERVQVSEWVSIPTFPIGQVAWRLVRMFGRGALLAIPVALMATGVGMWVTTLVTLKAVDRFAEMVGIRVPWGSHAFRMVYGFGLFAPTVLIWVAGATLFVRVSRLRS